MTHLKMLVYRKMYDGNMKNSKRIPQDGLLIILERLLVLQNFLPKDVRTLHLPFILVSDLLRSLRPPTAHFCL